MLSKKVAIVTGSTSGIGLGIAQRLAKEGCHLVINGLGDEQEIEKTCQTLRTTYNVEVLFHGADLSQTEACQDLVQATLERWNRVDILVNNAGIQHVAPIETFSLDQWRKVVDINLTAPFALMQDVLPSMRRHNWGRIINIASVHGLVASTGKSAYVAAKHGLLGLTKVVALETATTAITCNAICPGWVLTPLVTQQIEQRAQEHHCSTEEEKKALLLEKQPSGEFAQVEQLGGLAVFLCSADADQIRGAALTMDGGWTIQ